MTIKTSDRFYRELFKTAQDGIVLIDSHTGIVLDVNKSMVNLLGYSKKDFLKKHIWKLDAFKEVVPSKKHFAAWQVKENKRLENIELKTKTGKKVSVDLALKVYGVADATLIQCSIHDVTAYKQTAEVLVNSETKLRLMFESAIDGILVADVQTKQFVMANPAICKFLGYDKKEILKMSVVDIHPKEQLPMVLSQFRKQSRKKIKIAEEIPCKKRDGTVVYADIASTPFKIGKRILLVGFFRDVTERKKTEEALRKSEKRYHDIFEASKEALMLLDENCFFDCNRATLKMFGYKTVKAFCKKHPGQVSPPTQPDGTTSMELANKRIADTFKKGSNLFEWVHRRKNGEDFPASVLLVPFELEGRKVLQATVRDITEAKHVERRLGDSLHFLRNMNQVHRAMQEGRDLEKMMNKVLSVVLKVFDCDRAWLFYPCDPNARLFQVPMEVCKPEYPGANILNVDIPMSLDLAKDLREVLKSTKPVAYAVGTKRPVNKVSAEQFGVKSQLMSSIHPKLDKPWIFGIHQCSYPRIWTDEEKNLFQEIGWRLSDGLTSLLAYRNLQQSEEKLKDAQRLTHMGNWVLDLATNKLSWSDEIYRIFEINPKKFGASYEAFLGMVHPDDRDSVNKAYMDSLKNKTPYRISHRLLMKNGRIKYVIEYRETYYTPGGHPLASIGTVQDVTELKEAEELLKASKDRAEAILASIDDAVVACDKTGKIILFNHVAAALTGFSVQEAMGQHYKKILNFSKGNTDEPSEDFIQKASVEGYGTFTTNHTVIINKHGVKTPVVSNAAPIFDKSGTITGCVVVSHDVTEAQRVDKAKTEFISLASHQLRTPLASIRWIVEMFLTGNFGKITDKQKEKVEVINQSGLRMVELVNALLNVSRLELGSLTVKTQPVQVSKILDETVMDFELQAKVKQITVARNYSKKLPTVISDPALLKIILQNLLSNAISYSPPKTTITIKFEKDKENFLLTVIDQGIGILKADQPKIFSKLFRADNARLFQPDGTGLGLYMTKSIVDMMNGKIWVDSKINKGASFQVLLPLKGMTNRVGNGPMATSHVLPTEQ